MRYTRSLAAGAMLLLVCGAAGLAGQGGAPPAAPQNAPLGNPAGRGGAAAPAQGPRGAPRGGNPNATFPAQQRPPGDAAVIARGNTLYGIHCRSCHGVDLRGGEQGGPNLLRSQVVFNDKAGELIEPIVRDGLKNPGMSAMPSFTLPVDDVRAIAEYLHSVMATSRGQGAPPPGPPVTLNVLVGDAGAGRAYFNSKCSACHSVTGDMSGIGTRMPNPTQLQNFWVGGGGGRGGGGNANPVTVTVTPPTGQKVEGRLGRVDDFIVIVILADGTSRSFRRDGDVPKIEIKDPRQAHLKLLPTYTDKDIHDVTAYLVTLK